MPEGKAKTTRIEKVSWGKVKIDGKTYHQVLIVGSEVFERDKPKLETLFGTTHQLGDWEKEKLVAGNPELILVASGWSGLLKIDPEFENLVRTKEIELRVVLTPKVISEYNQLLKDKKRVNVLIHTTC